MYVCKLTDCTCCVQRLHMQMVTGAKVMETDLFWLRHCRHVSGIVPWNGNPGHQRSKFAVIHTVVVASRPLLFLDWWWIPMTWSDWNPYLRNKKRHTNKMSGQRSDLGNCSSAGQLTTEGLAVRARLHPSLWCCVLYPHYLVWRWQSARWWSEGLSGANDSHASVSRPRGSCGYTRSLTPPAWMNHGGVPWEAQCK